MAYYEKPKPEKKQPKWQTLQVNSGLGVFACIISVGISGYVAIVVNNPDQGRTLTLVQMKQLMVAEVDRIKNDPYMPPQAKAIALRAIQSSGKLGPE
jgi:cytochrome b561